jgi:Glyoxalase-like domain
LPGGLPRWQAVGVPTRLVHLVIDATHPAALARFWAAALGWEIAAEEPGEVVVRPSGSSDPDAAALPLVIVGVAEGSEFCVLSPR